MEQETSPLRIIYHVFSTRNKYATGGKGFDPYFAVIDFDLNGSKRGRRRIVNTHDMEDLANACVFTHVDFTQTLWKKEEYSEIISFNYDNPDSIKSFDSSTFSRNGVISYDSKRGFERELAKQLRRIMFVQEPVRRIRLKLTKPNLENL